MTQNPHARRNAYQQAADRWLDKIEAGQQYQRVPLRTEQHILHLLLTVFTVGLWAPVWIILAINGNKVPLPPGQQPHGLARCPGCGGTITPGFEGMHQAHTPAEGG